MCDNDTTTTPLIEESCNLNCEDCTKLISFEPTTKMKCIDSGEKWIRGVAVLRCDYSGQSNVTLELGDFSKLTIQNAASLLVNPSALSFLPIYRFQLGCYGNFDIPFTLGSENATCQWENETGIVKGAALSEDCKLTFSMNDESEPGYQMMSIMVNSNGQELLMQFYVFSYISLHSCSYKASLANQESCVVVNEDDTLELTVKAVDHYNPITLYEITRPTPLQPVVTVNNITNDEGIAIEVTMPDRNHLSESICINALLNSLDSSLPKCIQFMSISKDVLFNIPNNGDFDFENLIISMEFADKIRINQDINYVYARIFKENSYILTFSNGDYRISIVNGNKFTLDLNGFSQLELGQEYQVVIDKGFLQYDFGCKAILPRLNFTFSPKNLRKPLLLFTYNPDTKSTNTTMKISWTSATVNRTDECILWTLLTNRTEFVNCESSAYETEDTLGEGSYVLIVNSNDTLGNSATYNLDFNIDRTAPEARFSTLPSKVANLDSHNRRFSIYCYGHSCTADIKVISNSTEEVIEEISFALFSFTQSGQITASMEHLQTYTLQAYVYDLAGNSIKLEYEWKIDNVDPIITLSNDSSVNCDTFESLIEPSAVDDHNVTIIYRDIYDSCTLTRTWYVSDIADNVASKEQIYAVINPLKINAINQIFINCDSAQSPPLIAPEPLENVFTNCFNYYDKIPFTIEESTENLPCPGTWKRTYSALNTCSGLNQTFEQSIETTDICPPFACYRNTSDPRGECIVGECYCSIPYFGDNCQDEVHPPILSDTGLQITLNEFQSLDFAPIVISGTEPFAWNLEEEPHEMILETQSGRITWINPAIGNYTFLIEASNVAGSDTKTVNLVVQTSYTTQLNSLAETVYPKVETVIITGFVSPSLSNIPVKIAILYSGVTTFYDIVTESDGSFFLVFRTGQYAYGAYKATSFHPKLSPDFNTHSIEWNFLGFKSSPSSISIRDIAYDDILTKTYADVANVINDGPKNLHNLKMRISGESQLKDLGITMDIQLDSNEATFEVVSVCFPNYKCNFHHLVNILFVFSWNQEL